MDPMRVWATWSLRQIVRMHNLAMRQWWRDRAWDAALHGADMGPEPEWDLGQHRAPEVAHTDDEFREFVRRKRGH
jgi:hypothetical protein